MNDALEEAARVLSLLAEGRLPDMTGEEYREIAETLREFSDEQRREQGAGR